MSKKKGKLETKVLKYQPLKDAKGRYIPICNYSWHIGMIKDDGICVKRKCRHYDRYYLK